MVSSLMLLIATISKSCAANRINPIALTREVDAHAPMSHSPGRFLRPQMQTGANEGNIPEILKREGAGQSWRANNRDVTSDWRNLSQSLAEVSESDIVVRSMAKLHPKALAGRSRPGHLAPLRGWRPRFDPKMSVADQQEETREARVTSLRENLQALQGSGDEGKPILSVSLAKFDPLDLGNQLRAVVAVAKKMDISLMFHAGPQREPFTMKDNFISAGLQDAIRGAEDFDEVPLDTKLTLDLSNPHQGIKTIDSYAKAGSDIITFHPEATTQVTAMLDRIKSHGILSGLVMNPGTSVSSIEHLLKHNELEMVVIMLVNPGFGGSKYIDAALDKIREIKRICQANNVPEPYISVDGGVNKENAPIFLEEGVNVIVAGGSVVDAIAKNDEMVAARAIQALLPGHASIETIVEQTANAIARPVQT